MKTTIVLITILSFNISGTLPHIVVWDCLFVLLSLIIFARVKCITVYLLCKAEELLAWIKLKGRENICK